MDFQCILYQAEDGIATITLNRPEAYNALNAQINRELIAGLSRVGADGEIRALILTGGPKVFAAGADVAEMAGAGPVKAYRYCEDGRRINRILEELPIPVIAAVNGMALGGGCELSLACDFRVAGEKTVFGLPETGLGILPGAGGTQRLPRLIGASRAKEMILLGKRVSGAEAFSIGLANALVPDENVYQEAMRMARKLAGMPRLAVEFAKRAVNAGTELGWDAGHRQEHMCFSMLFSTEDQKEGMQAFLEKRPPAYTGR